jgi:hypothetical protein
MRFSVSDIAVRNSAGTALFFEYQPEIQAPVSPGIMISTTKRSKGNALQNFARFAGIASISDAKAAFFEKPAKQNAKPFIIIDDKDVML